MSVRATLDLYVDSLSLRSWPCQFLSFFSFPTFSWHLYGRTYIRISDTSAPSWSISGKDPVFLSCLYTTPANVTFSYQASENNPFFPPCSTGGSAATITSVTELQMSLCLASQSHLLSLVASGSLMGVHACDTQTEQMWPHEWEWVSGALRCTLERPTELSSNTRKPKKERPC